MSNIYVKEDIKALGLQKGDVLFYRSDDNMYEWYSNKEISKEGLDYKSQESVKFSVDYLVPFLENGDMSEFEMPEDIDELTQTELYLDMISDIIESNKGDL